MADDWKKALKLPESGHTMMEASFAAQGSRPYHKIGSKDDIQIGIKPFGFNAPFTAMGVRVRVQWKPGDYELPAVAAKLKLALAEGQSSYNAAAVFLLPLLYLPTDLSAVRKRWQEVNGPALIADAIETWRKDVEVVACMSKDEIALLIEDGINEVFPDFPAQPIEPVVCGLDGLNSIAQQLKK